MGLIIVSNDRSTRPVGRARARIGRIELPPGIRPYRCLTPVSMDPYKVCGATFIPGQERAYETHVTRCSDEHIDVIRQLSRAVQMPAFYGPESGDPEFERWVGIHRDELREGRKRM